MAEHSTSTWQRLFEVRLLHHYWLDDGATLFDSLAADVQTERLLTYDIRPVLRVMPTPATGKQLDGLHGRYIATGTGFVVAVPTNATLAADATLMFTVSIADSRYVQYTALTFRRQELHDASDPTDHSPEKVVYRYKENVPALSNLTGITRNLNGDTQLFLSSEYPAASAGDKVEALVESGGALLQLSGDNPGADTLQLAASITDMPVFVHQGDAPVIVPPAGVSGAPARGVQITDEVPDDTLVLIQLTAARNDNDAFSLVDAVGSPKTAPPVFEVRLKNRSTYWDYFDKRTGIPGAAGTQPLPLTHFGNAGIRQKPSRGTVKAQKSGSRITRLVSEIYI